MENKTKKVVAYLRVGSKEQLSNKTLENPLKYYLMNMLKNHQK